MELSFVLKEFTFAPAVKGLVVSHSLQKSQRLKNHAQMCHP